jgi:hypothetical protein
MIKINALYLLLLLELLVIFAGLVAYLIVREKKGIILYRENKSELERAHAAKEELQQQVAELKAGAAQAAKRANKEMDAAAKNRPAPGVDTKDLDACKMEITVLEEQLKEKTKLLIDLQAKLDSVEKEYLLLYQQQQAQEQHKN